MSVTRRTRFILLVVCALLLSAFPIIHYPFGWFETFFHELSHGLVALISGGKLHRIELNFDGSGLCTTAGGAELLILFAGYAGSAIWGSLVYLSVSKNKAYHAKAISVFLSALILLVAILWARDLITFVILGVIGSLFVFAYRYGSGQTTQLIIEFLAIYIVLDAIRSPLHLLDGRSIGDGSELAQITRIPEIFWVAIWFLLACGCLYFLFKKSSPS
jgi:hypothetical protein